VKRAEIIQLLIDTFTPLVLSIGRPGVALAFNEAARKYNKYSSVLAFESFPYNGEAVLEMPARVDSIVDVIQYRPTVGVSSIITPEAVILGVNRLPQGDYFLLFAMIQEYKQIMRLFSGGFTYRFVKPYLYVDDANIKTSYLTVQYMYNFDGMDENFEWSGAALDWVISYALAEIKDNEGRVLRNASVVGIDTDGESLATEGKTAKEALLEQLRGESSPFIGLKG
jgi:hypothetical protein